MMRLIRKKMFCRWGLHAPLMDVTFDRNHGTTYQCQNCYTLLKNWRLCELRDDARDYFFLATLIFMILLSGATWHAQIEAERIVAESEFTVGWHEGLYHRATLPRRSAWGEFDRAGNFIPTLIPHWCTKVWTDDDGKERKGINCVF